MVTEFWARLEDAAGNIVAPDPAWTPQRQFLWEVVHDQRGVFRDESFGEPLRRVRTIDRAPGRGGPQLALDPAEVKAAYERLWAHARTFPDAPRFRLVAPHGGNAWAAVQFFEDAGTEYGLVGGWTGPVLRILAPEPDQQFLPDQPTVTVGTQRFDVRAVPFAEYFGADVASLLRVLEDAASRRLRVRFLQR